MGFFKSMSQNQIVVIQIDPMKSVKGAQKGKVK